MAKTVLTKYLTGRLFGIAKTLLTNYHTGRLFGTEGYDPFNKVSNERRPFGMAKTLLPHYHMSRLFGRAKTRLTKYPMSADCLVGQRTF